MAKTTIQEFNNRILYIEPNYTFDINSSITTNNETVMQAPLLEDYCIALDIEAELVDRSGNYHLPSSLEEDVNTNNFIRLSWASKDQGSEISFMSGKKIYTKQDSADMMGLKSPVRKDEGGTYWVNSLTTDYTGAYYDEIIQHGTTEMFGIKSVDVSYRNYSVPEVVVKFTDVRGASLFANTEARKTKSYKNYDGFSADDMAQLFFQCFFTTPYPRFRLTIKGFYGQPVAYEMQCTDFRAAFSSSDGNFDVTAKFIGYTFSFLSDVSMCALLAAPYAEQYGKKYWDNRNFTLANGEPLPTLVDLYTKVNGVYSVANAEMENSPEAQEYRANVQKINVLNRIVDVHNNLVGCLCEHAKSTMSGKDNAPRSDIRLQLLSQTEIQTGTAITSNNYNTCSLLCCLVTQQANGNFKDWLKISTTTSNGQNYDTLVQALNAAIKAFNTTYPDSTQIAEFNNNLSFKAKNTWVQVHNKHQETNSGGQLKVHKDCHDDDKGKANALVNKVNSCLNSNNGKYLYNDEQGAQPTNCVYAIEFPYINQVNELISQLNNQVQAYNSEEGIDERNKKEAEVIEKQLGDVFSVENITRIILAHFETTMHMMYQCVQEILDSHRTIESLGLDSSLNLTDIQENSGGDTIVPPFPRISHMTREQNDDKITKITDTWVGDISSTGFRERDLIMDFFNGADTVATTIAQSDKESNDLLNNQGGTPDTNETTNLIEELMNGNDVGAQNLKHITNLFDIFTNAYVFPTDIEVTNNITAFIHAISLRAFATLTLDYYASNADKKSAFNDIGKADAMNFLKQHPSLGKDNALYKYFRSSENKAITDEILWQVVATATEDESIRALRQNKRWKGDLLFAQNVNRNWLYQYPIGKKNFAYPIQGYQLSDDNTTYSTNTDSYIHYLKDCTVEDGKKYASKEMSYQILPFSVAKKINGVITNKVNGTDFKDSSFGKLLTSITYNTRDYGKIFNPNELIAPRVADGKMVKKWVDETAMQNIGDENEGIKKNSFLITGAKPYYNKNGQWVIANNKNNPTQHISDPTQQNLFSNPQMVSNSTTALYTNSSTNVPQVVQEGTVKYQNKVYYYNYADKKTFTGISSTDNYYVIGWVFDNPTTNVLTQKKTKIRCIVVNTIKTSNNTKTAEFVPTNKLYTTSRKTLPSTNVPQVNELYSCQAYQNLKDNWLKAACIVCCIPIIKDKEFKKLLGTPSDGTGQGQETPFVFVPKLLAYQMGAILYAYDHYRTQTQYKGLSLNYKSISTILPCADMPNVFTYLKSLSQISRQKLKNYFEKNCVKTKFVSIYENYAKKKTDIFTPCFVKNTDDLLSPVMLFKVSRYAEGGKWNGNTHNLSTTTFNQDVYTAYMNGFLNTLRTQWGVNVGEEGQRDKDRETQLVHASPNTTKDMYVALYQYLKVLYDRWIPNFPESEWKMEDFFNDNSEKGHTFHFIDSYYTEIGKVAKVNLQSIRDTIRNLTRQNNFKSNLFDFMTTIFQKNNFMLLCTQNFMDLSKKENLETMFKPVPYLEMKKPKRHPDFVAIYVYTPSQRLAIANGQYADDSFMLNGTETDKLPLPLQSGNITHQSKYKLPSFGVAYGMQYQNYFTDIAVDMETPQATEAVIKTKMSIVNDNLKLQGKSANFVGQDLFDVYSNTAYKCTVKMLGNAWVQPLMYFCLTNIPMFRGAYLIYEVKHNLEPGMMTTTFTGMRMSKIASPFTESPVIGGVSQNDIDRIQQLRYKYANVTNNCEYHVFPLFEADEMGEDRSALLREPVTSKFYRKGRAPKDNFANLEEAIAYGIAGEDNSDEMAMHLHAVLFYNTSILQPNQLVDNGRFSTYRSSLKGKFTDEYIAKIKTIVRKTFQNPAYMLSLGFASKPYTSAKLSCYTSGTHFKKGDSLNVSKQVTATDLSRLYYTVAASVWNSNVLKAANSPKNGYYPHYCMDVLLNHNGTVYGAENASSKPCWSAKKTGTNADAEKVDIATALFYAIEKTINTAEAAACELKLTVINQKEKTIEITQRNGQNDHLSQVFDVVLNGYYEYVHNLLWIIKNENGYINKNPQAVRIQVQDKATNSEKTIGMAIVQGNGLMLKKAELEYETQISTDYACALYKQYNNNDVVYNKEVKTKVKDLASKVKLTDCSTFIQPEGRGGILQGNYIGADKWNAKAASKYLIANDAGSSQHVCAAAVKSAIAVGGIPYQGGCNGNTTVQWYIDHCHFVEVAHGNNVQTDGTYKSLMSHPQIGDICSFLDGGTSNAGHVALYCNDGYWHSDWKQDQAEPYKGYNGKWQYARYSENGGAVTKSNTTTVKWYDKKYHGGGKSVNVVH